MSKFLTPLDCEKVEGTKDEWKLLKDLQYQSDLAGFITAPAGFVTDFASTPQIIWTFFPKDGQYDDAAVIHDFCYTTSKFDRFLCDQIFLEALQCLNVPTWQRYPMYWAVRAFGGLFYGK